MNTLIIATRIFTSIAATLIILAPGVVEAQRARSHPASDPAAIALQERHVRAVGGPRQPASQHFITEMQMGTQPPIRTETYIAEPDKLFVRTTVAGQLLIEFGYDGTTGWSSSPMTGLVRLDKAALEAMRASATSLATPEIDSTARQIAIGRSTFDDQIVDGVRAVSVDGDTAEIYYAVSTGLLAGMRARSAGDAPKDSLLMLVRDYKRIGGRMEHTTIIFRGMGMDGVTRTVHLDHEPIDPVKFKPPAGLPPLPPER